MEPNTELLSLGTAENDRQSCGPEQRGFIIVCGFHSVTLMRNQIESRGSLQKKKEKNKEGNI